MPWAAGEGGARGEARAKGRARRGGEKGNDQSTSNTAGSAAWHNTEATQGERDTENRELIHNIFTFFATKSERQRAL